MFNVVKVSSCSNNGTIRDEPYHTSVTKINFTEKAEQHMYRICHNVWRRQPLPLVNKLSVAIKLVKECKRSVKSLYSKGSCHSITNKGRIYRTFGKCCLCGKALCRHETSRGM